MGGILTTSLCRAFLFLPKWLRKRRNIFKLTALQRANGQNVTFLIVLLRLNGSGKLYRKRSYAQTFLSVSNQVGCSLLKKKIKIQQHGWKSCVGFSLVK